MLNVEPLKQKFIECMDDDFNVAQAIAVLFDLAREINRGRDEGLNIVEAQQTLAELAGVLGFTLDEPTRPPIDLQGVIGLVSKFSYEFKNASKSSSNSIAKAESLLSEATISNKPPDIEDLIQCLVDFREERRKAKEWQLADIVRNSLAELGIALEDTPRGTSWKRML